MQTLFLSFFYLILQTVIMANVCRICIIYTHEYDDDDVQKAPHLILAFFSLLPYVLIVDVVVAKKT